MTPPSVPPRANGTPLRRMAARSKMTQSYSPSTGRIRISLHFPLFNHTLTRLATTGAYLRHAVVGGTSQSLHNCVSAGLRSGTPHLWLSAGAAIALENGMWQRHHVIEITSHFPSSYHPAQYHK